MGAFPGNPMGDGLSNAAACADHNDNIARHLFSGGMVQFGFEQPIFDVKRFLARKPDIG
jgi:hypothetical protein